MSIDFRHAGSVLRNQDENVAFGESRCMKQLYLCWNDYQRRPDSMRSTVGYELRFIPPPFRSRLLKPFGYVWQSIASLWAVARFRPGVLWLQLPPSFLVHLMWIARLLSAGRMRLVADCHNAMLRPPWSKFPVTIALLNRMDLVLAHNQEALAQARSLGITTPRLHLLETRPAQLNGPVCVETESRQTGGTPTILVPLSYGVDEPVDVVLSSAARLPDVTFLLTGHLEKARAKGYVGRAPVNVRFTGKADVAEYNRLLLECDVVLGITAFEGIQLSVANEAVGAAKPLVLSDTAILRELFAAAALFSPNEPEALARMLRSALARKAQLAVRSRELATIREIRWNAQLQSALSAIGVEIPTVSETDVGGAWNSVPAATRKWPR